MHIIDKRIGYNGEYALIHNPSNRCTPFIVAWLPKETENGLIWAQGHYFNKIEDAVEDFIERTKA